jgi:hypothetical protein
MNWICAHLVILLKRMYSWKLVFMILLQLCCDYGTGNKLILLLYIL